MNAVRSLTVLAIIVGLTGSAQAQFRNQAPKNQPKAAPAQTLQNRVQPIPLDNQGNFQPRSNITYGNNPLNNPFNPGAFPTPLNNYANPYATPVTPFATPMNPYATPYATPLSPYATPLNPYAAPVIGPAYNPYQIQTPLSPFNTLTPAQQLMLQQQNALGVYNQIPMNPLLQNNFAPVVGVGGNGFAGNR